MIKIDLKDSWDKAYAAAERRIPERTERRLKAILHDDVPTFMELPYIQTEKQLKNTDVAFLGIPWEGLRYLDPWTILPATASPAFANSIYYRTGADQAPDHIRKYSIFYSYNHGWGYFPELGKDFILFDHINAGDNGNVEVTVSDPETSLERCYNAISRLYEAGTIPLIAGGDHAIPLPAVKALANHTRGNIGIITFDSHFDLYYDPEFSAASQWVRLLELTNVDPANYCSIGIRGLRNQVHEKYVAEELGLSFFTMAEIESDGIPAIIERALSIASKNTDSLYISLDIDVMDPAFCPAQKYPEPGGLSSREIITALRKLGRTKLINGFDICCLGPQYDSPTGISGQLCARLFVEVLGTIAWQRRSGYGHPD
ncbi:MAG: agmatinase family protein [Candidatus Heimdallarchaeota archaeon]